MIYIIIVVFVLLFLIFCYYENNKIDITKYEINCNSAESDIKIVHLSDLHSKPFKAVIKNAEEQNPDIIVITGD